MTTAQMRISTLRHNRARGKEDVELTGELLRELETLGALDWAQHSLDMDDVEIQRLIEDVSAPETLAGEEYSRPWQPVMEGLKPTEEDVSMSIQASDHLRVMEKKIKSARTEEARQLARKDAQISRVTLIYTPDEAKTVRKALGKDPAGTVLKWSQTHLEAQQKKLTQK